MNSQYTSLTAITASKRKHEDDLSLKKKRLVIKYFFTYTLDIQEVIHTLSLHTVYQGTLGPH